MKKLNKKGEESTTISLSFLIGLFFACVMIILLFWIGFKLYDSFIGFNNVNKHALVNYQRLSNDIDIAITNNKDIRDIFVVYSPYLIEGSEYFGKYVEDRKSVANFKVMVIGEVPKIINNQEYKNSILFVDDPDYTKMDSWPTKVYTQKQLNKKVSIFNEGLSRDVIFISYNVISEGLTSYDDYFLVSATKFNFVSIEPRDDRITFKLESQWKDKNNVIVDKTDYLKNEVSKDK